MQTYVVIMIILVAAGTLFDIVHKGSAKYFFSNWEVKTKGKQVGGGELVSIARQDRGRRRARLGRVLQPARRIAHLLTMYGFVMHVVSTVVMVFATRRPIACGRTCGGSAA